MSRTAKILGLTLGSVASIMGLTDCAKDGEKPKNPLSPDTSDPGTDWNTLSIEKIVSSSVTNADISIAVLGSYDPNSTVVEINGVQTANYVPEVTDQMYTVTMKLPVGKFTITVNDTDDSKKEKREVVVMPNYSKDIFNNTTDLRASSYKSDVNSTNSRAVGVNKAMDMFQRAMSGLSPGMQTVANGFVSGTDAHIKYQNIDQVVFGAANVYLIDKQGRVIVPDFTQADVDALRSKY